MKLLIGIMTAVAILHALVLLIPFRPSIHTTQIELVAQPLIESQTDMLREQSAAFGEETFIIICKPPDER